MDVLTSLRPTESDIRPAVSTSESAAGTVLRADRQSLYQSGRLGVGSLWRNGGGGGGAGGGGGGGGGGLATVCQALGRHSVTCEIYDVGAKSLFNRIRRGAIRVVPDQISVSGV